MGEIIDDKNLYTNLVNIVKKDPMLEDSHISFNVYDDSVLMTGETPSADLKNHLENTIKTKAKKMKQLVNEVTVMKNSSYLSRAKDGVITVQIETLFLNQEVFHPTHIRIHTERGTVYLMGAVTKREAEHATNVASKAKNVKKVVKLFNYLLVRPAEEIERDNKNKIEAEKRAALEAKKAELEAAQSELQSQIDEINSN
jgi:osmotically-inducible protein OsmY